MSGLPCYSCTLHRDREGRVNEVELTVVLDDNTSRVLSLNGHRGVRVVGPVHDLLRARGVGARSWAAAEAIVLDVATGAQLELLLRAVRPLRRGDRIDTIAEGIAAMGREEASYWHAKAARGAGLRALRLLLAQTP